MSNAKLIFGTMPIGDPEDATYNLISYIKKSDVIAVENEGEVQNIIDHYGLAISGKIISISPKNFMKEGLVNNKSGLTNSLSSVHKEILEYIKDGKTVLCLSDEGSPIVTDPFIYLRQLAIAQKVDYKVLPGPSAVISAISYSKLYSGSSFCFYGMLFYDPNKLKIYNTIKESPHASVVFYHHEVQESFLNELLVFLGLDRKVTLVSNMTSGNQLIMDGNFGDIRDFVLDNDVRQPTLVISGKSVL